MAPDSKENHIVFLLFYLTIHCGICCGLMKAILMGCHNVQFKWNGIKCKIYIKYSFLSEPLLCCAYMYMYMYSIYVIFADLYILALLSLTANIT